MRYPTVCLAVIGMVASAFSAESGWRPLWNGRDFDGWSTWVGKPQPTSEVPGLPKDSSGKYSEPLGVRDVLHVFTIAGTDGQPAIRISGEVFGELRSRDSFRDYRL